MRQAKLFPPKPPPVYISPRDITSEALMKSLSTSTKSLLFPHSRRLSITLLAFACILAVTFAAAAPQDSTLVNLAKIREAWLQDLRTKQLEPILKFYAPDAAFLNGERITGSSALRTLFQNVMATYNSDLTLHSQSLEISGDLAYDSGDYQETLTTIAS